MLQECRGTCQVNPDSGRYRTALAGQADGLHDFVIGVFCTGVQDCFYVRQLPTHFFTPHLIHARQLHMLLGFTQQLPAVSCLQRRQKTQAPRHLDLHDSCQVRSQGRVKSERILLAGTTHHVLSQGTVCLSTPLPKTRWPCLRKP